MARITDDTTSGQTGHNPLRFEAEPGVRIELPSNDFIGDSQILRDGQDLILRASDGSEVIVENYFLAEPSPLLVSPNGALTPELVDSFAKPLDGVQMAQKGSMDDSSPVGMVREVSGEATVTHANGITEKASVGTPIYQDDIIETKGEGAVNITFVDDTSFAVSSNARLAIDEYVFDPHTQSGETNFSVMQGVFVFTSGLIGREDPDDVNIETPVGSIGIRGTTIMGTIDPDGQSQITVVEGAIVVTNDSGEQTLSQQYETVMIDGYTSDIVQAGTLSTEELSENYNVLRTVSAQLFSQIDDSTSASEGELDMDSPDSVPEETDSAPDSTLEMAPQEPVETDAPADSSDGTTSEESKSETDLLQNEPLMLDQETEFDVAAGTQTNTLDSFTTTESSTMTTADSFLAPTSPTGDFKTTTTNSTTTTTTTTIVSNTTPPPYDLLINSLIGSASPNFIPGVGGSGFRQGYSVLSLSDYNHDGQADFAFTNAMELVLHLPVTPLDLTSPYGLSPGSSHIASYLGDINGDGIGDLILGSSGEGGGQGKVTVMDLNDPATTFWQINGEAGTTEFGDSVSGIGDFNGDGYNDMLVGAPAFGGGSSYSYVIYGGSNFYGSGVDLTYMGTNPTDPDGFRIAAGINTFMGETIVGLQDFNGDGYSDFVTSKPGSDSIALVYGSATTMTSSTITGINATTEIPLSYAGDMNGGGKSDLALYEEGTDTLHVLFGENALTTTQSLASITNKLSIVSSTGTIIGGGYAGDFNGDGFDDIAVASRNGSLVDLYVVYGRPGMTGTIDLASINLANSFHARIDLAGTAFDFNAPATDPFDITIETMGDRNNDGYDDLMIGLPNIDRDGTATHSDDGGIVIIEGRHEISGVTPNIIQANPGATATGSNQTLAGNAANNFMSNDNATNTGTRFLGAGGDDHFRVFGGPPAELNGGAGIDAVEFMSNGLINLGNMGENLSGMERIIMAGGTQTLTLGIDDIFRLLQDSANGTLTIDGNAGTQLIINDNTGADPTTENLTYFGFTYTGDTNSASLGGYNTYDFGTGYTVYISDTIAATQVA